MFNKKKKKDLWLLTKTPCCGDCKWLEKRSQIMLATTEYCQAQGFKHASAVYNSKECKSLYQRKRFERINKIDIEKLTGRPKQK